MMEQNKKIKYRFGTRDTYSYYKKAASKPVNIAIYILVLSGYLKFLMSLIYSGQHVRLPSRMGEVYIQGIKVPIKFSESGKLKNFGPDWKATNKLWRECEECKNRKQLVYHLNEATQGILYKLTWSKKTMLTGNKSLYSLQFTRENKRTTSKLIQEGKEYMVN